MNRTLTAHPVAWFLALAAALAGCSAYDATRGAPDTGAAAKPAKTAPTPVAWTPPAPPARKPFDHKFHLGKGLECADCHSDEEKGEIAILPKLEACTECHKLDDASPGEWTVRPFLAKDGATPLWSHVTEQSPDVVFSHEVHAKKEIACAECHTGIAESTAVSHELFVDMDRCTKCHETKKAKTDCATCHRAAEQRVAEGKGPYFLPANHGAAWKGDHGAVSRLASPRVRAERCDDCHGKPQFPASGACATCHAATKPASHDASWRGAHGGDVKDDRASVAQRCGTCHDGAEFPAASKCDVCHVSTKPASHDRLWTDMHGQAVRDDPSSASGRCAFCHDRREFPSQSKCTGCHMTEPPRDHTQSWRVDGGHGLSAAMDRGRCAACHTADSCETCHATVEPRSHRGAWGAPRDRHCVNCHAPLRSEDGCGVCHKGTPSHASAPPLPSEPPHTPDLTCRKCHFAPRNLRHADNGTNCVACHR